MERLVIHRCGDRELNCPACPKYGDCADNADCVEVLMERLNDYENIGLDPEELKALLQEKAQREQGCEYCDFSSGSCGEILDGEEDFFLITPDNSHEFYIATDGKGVFRETKIHFCPMCGRKLDGGDA